MKGIIAFIQSGGGANVKTIPLNIAHQLGYQVAVFDKNERDIFGLADYYYSVDTDNIDLLLTQFGLFYKEHKVEAVLTFTEFAVEQTAIIANVYGLPGLNVGAAKICRNKLLTRLVLEKNNIPQNKYLCVNNLDDNIDYIENNLTYPIVIKPLMFAGSCAVTRVNNRTELLKMIDDVKGERKRAPMNVWSKDNLPNLWMYEEYLDGYEISVEGITCQGKTEILAIHDKMTPMEGPVFLEEFFVTPSPRMDEELATEIKDLTCKILNTIGFDFGISHVEYRITKDGPRLLEINARIGGGLTGDSVEYSTSINMIESLIRLAVGLPVDLVPKYRKPTAIGVIYSDAGEIKEVQGIDEALQIDGVKVVKQWLKPGDIVKAKQVGYGADVLIVSEHSPEDAFLKAKEASEIIKFITV